MDRQPSNTGDGHKMALWAGRSFRTATRALRSSYGECIRRSGFPASKYRGKRFVNEDARRDSRWAVRLRICRTKRRGRSWTGTGEAIYRRRVSNHGSVCFVMEDEELEAGRYDKLCFIDNYIAPKYVRKAVEDGVLLEAETLEELIVKTGLPADTALASVEQYNRLCEQGRGHGLRQEKGPAVCSKQGAISCSKIYTGSHDCGYGRNPE